MTPQEAQLVDELFDRLAKLEAAPRDAAAERLIAEGLQRAPHAVYALVQTALLQDEALKRANARIEELQARAAATEPGQRPASFLDSMRAAFAGGTPRGSVPNVPAQSRQPHDSPPQPSRPSDATPFPPGPGAASGFGAGGSFLGTAASAAAGVIGGALLLDGIRSMFGHHFGGPGASAFGDFRNDPASPWSGSAGGTSDGDLASAAGIDHIGDHIHDAGDDAAPADTFAPTDDESLADDNDPGSDDAALDGDDGGFGDDGFGDDSYDV
jgi:hypothetical protein